MDLLDSESKVEKDLMKDMQALTLKGDTDTQTVADIQVTNAEEQNNNNQMREEDNTSVPLYDMTEQELWLQKGEANYNTYISIIGYKGDDSDLETKMDIESKGQAYPFLD